MPAGTVSLHWQRFVRLSVRGLIIVVLVIGVGLGWLVRSARIQRETVAAIQKAGGHVFYDWEWSNGKSIPMGKPWARRWFIDRIGVDYFDHVTHVSVTPNGADDALIAQVGRLTRLQVLWHDQSGFDCDYITSTLSDAGLSHLTGLTDLSLLCVRSSQVTDAGLLHLRGLTNLTVLYLDGNRLTDAGLAHLTVLKRLTSLSLVGTQVTDAGLVHLRGLTDLSELNLCDTQVANAGLAHLKGLTKLSELYLISTQVTDAGVRDLQRALPNLKIHR
jgi:Leucine Rich repeat